MVVTTILKPRGYQQEILDFTLEYSQQGNNPLIELDCGLGKRFLQYSLLTDSFPDQTILLVLQASTSLYETFSYLKEHAREEDIELIDSRIPSDIRVKKLNNHRIILCLPQTLANTLKKFPFAVDHFDIIIINEVDQIIKRMGSKHSIKIPYPQLLNKFADKTIIGMSGTLRDEHFIMDHQQLQIRKELETLTSMIPNARLISMDQIQTTDLEDHITLSNVIPTAVEDTRISLISMELELHLDEMKESVLKLLMEEDPTMYFEAKKDFSKLFGPLPLEPDIINKFHQGYLVRKYLWAMTGKKSAIHLINYGMDKSYIWETIPRIPAKFIAVKYLVQRYSKSVVLCSYLDTVSTLQELLEKAGLETIVVSGQIPIHSRNKSLDHFRKTDSQIIALLSNVGERDLDLPEADLLIIFDLINTTKTVYQKLKRSRGGDCRILYYSDTKEQRKTSNVVNKINEKYSWSTTILPDDYLKMS
ncbi:MAG: DEAD/DEAH box helicase family protein [Candidatus Heimdallarchaeota archaeon]|nr:DEAD/DEAH box helicase family protein [Candidatus Heimdallarchaeota archaeon]